MWEPTADLPDHACEVKEVALHTKGVGVEAGEHVIFCHCLEDVALIPDGRQEIFANRLHDLQVNAVREPAEGVSTWQTNFLRGACSPAS